MAWKAHLDAAHTLLVTVLSAFTWSESITTFRNYILIPSERSAKMKKSDIKAPTVQRYCLKAFTAKYTGLKMLRQMATRLT